MTRANFDDGSYRKTGHGHWAEYNKNGAGNPNLTETGRDKWSAYLDDRSDLYRINSFSRQQVRSPVPRPSPRPPPRPASDKRNINAGPIWNQRDAKTKSVRPWPPLKGAMDRPVADHGAGQNVGLRNGILEERSIGNRPLKHKQKAPLDHLQRGFF
ncbi:hypothetical protein [Parasphingorhabdus sp.]|uniref:hypothetical protein n=1 Tax=Parasphingorhabdus sp. TaxID=2709688 RepID=UPI003002AAE9